jgi:hypothetical protein
MLPTLLTKIFLEKGKEVLTKVLTSSDDMQRATAELEKAAVEFEAQGMAAQASTNTEEAKSANVFVAGWRPFVGWVCGVSFALAYVPKVLVITVLWTYQSFDVINAGGTALPAYPDLGTGELLTLLGAMFGGVGARSVDKFLGTDIKKVGGR